MTDSSMLSTTTTSSDIIDYMHPCFWHQHSRFYKVYLAWYSAKVWFRARKRDLKWRLRRAKDDK